MDGLLWHSTGTGSAGAGAAPIVHAGLGQLIGTVLINSADMSLRRVFIELDPKCDAKSGSPTVVGVKFLEIAQVEIDSTVTAVCVVPGSNSSSGDERQTRIVFGTHLGGIEFNRLQLSEWAEKKVGSDHSGPVPVTAMEYEQFGVSHVFVSSGPFYHTVYRPGAACYTEPEISSIVALGDDRVITSSASGEGLRLWYIGAAETGSVPSVELTANNPAFAGRKYHAVSVIAN